jgi:cathepsin X
MPYIACSSNSTNGFCPHVDTSCSPMNICRTCLNPAKGGSCSAIHKFPNATVAEYGNYGEDSSISSIMAEIFIRGPVKASVNAGPLINYSGGILYDSPSLRNTTHNHGVSLVGWGYEESTDTQYWIARNSWGQYWGEMSFFRVELGKNLMGIESHISWATPGAFSTSNFPCSKDGKNCLEDHDYIDPSTNVAAVQRNLRKRH